MTAHTRTTAAPPIRIAHLGLGAFHRAHQAWYTAHASDAGEWGIAAFTGRSPDAALTLAAQDCLYSLVERGPERDSVETIESIVAALPGDDLPGLLRVFLLPDLALVTLTVTERGYRLRWDGALDADDPMTADDLRLLTSQDDGKRAPSTVIGRLLLGLDARRVAGLPGIALAPCDNVPDNGEFLKRGLLEAADRVDPRLAHWIESRVSFVSTSVDRITPRSTARDSADVRALTGVDDAAPVITEPFSDWVLSGAFPAGRPRWEDAGARFVDEIEPWERRKLWMLNGAHTILAAAGTERGHRTVSEAVSDPEVLNLVRSFWTEAGRHLPDEVEPLAYADELERRFRNPRIAHHLDQIATDSEDKMRLRIVPVAEAERRAGRSAEACGRAIAVWARSQGRDVRSSVETLSPTLLADPVFLAAAEATSSAGDAVPVA